MRNARRIWMVATLLTGAATLATGCVDTTDGAELTKTSACANMTSEGSAFYDPSAAPAEASPELGAGRVASAAGAARVESWLPSLHWQADSAAIFGLDGQLATLDGLVPEGGDSEAEEPATSEPDLPTEGSTTEGSTSEDGATGPASSGGSEGGADPGDSGQEPAPSEPGNATPTPEEPATPVSTGPVADPIFGQPYDSSVDPLQVYSPSQVDLSKDFMPGPGTSMPAFDNFLTTGLQPGQKVPEIELWNLDGKLVKLSQYKDLSNVAIIVGSASCMVFRRHSLAMWTKLHQRAAAATAKTGKKLEILVIYTQEAHPALENSIYADQQQWTGFENVADKVLVPMAKTFAERVTYARGLDARFPFNRANVWIDGHDNAVWKMLGEVPNAMFLVDSQGTLVWKELWAMHAGTEWNFAETWPAPDAKPTAFAMIDKLLGL